MSHVCQETNIKAWTHTFLESGHSFLPNDTDFGKIEKKKNMRESIYTSSHWIKLISDCNFSVHNMKGKFLNLNELLKTRTFRQSNSEGEKFNWLKLKWLKMTKLNPDQMEYRSTHDKNSTTKIYDFSSKRNAANDQPKTLENLYSAPVEISLEKYNDLMSLLPYVPQIYHQYFIQQPHSKSYKKKPAYHPDIIEEPEE